MISIYLLLEQLVTLSQSQTDITGTDYLARYFDVKAEKGAGDKLKRSELPSSWSWQSFKHLHAFGIVGLPLKALPDGFYEYPEL